MKDVIKAVAGTLLAVGIVISFLERKYAPNAVVTEDSPNFPSWIGWIGWIGWGIAAGATLVYVGIDVFDWWHTRHP